MTRFRDLPWPERKARAGELAGARLAEKARLAERQGEADAIRAAHEAYWLARERPPLGNTRRPKPLSRLPV